MMTAVLREGTEPEWDAAMRERLEAAGGRGGWIGGQLLIPLERLNQRVIIRTCDTRADWHADEAFRDTRSRIEGLEKRPSETTGTRSWPSSAGRPERPPRPWGDAPGGAARHAVAASSELPSSWRNKMSSLQNTLLRGRGRVAGWWRLGTEANYLSPPTAGNWRRAQ